MSSSPTARHCLLRADGELVWPDGQSGDAVSVHLLVLARELCRFHLFAGPAGVSQGRAVAAAQVHSEVQAPFEAAEALLLQTPQGVAIWWWDVERVTALLAGRAPYLRNRIIPESLIYGDGDGWLQREMHGGFEAQYREGGTVVASAWRRRPFDARQWRELAGGVEHPTIPPPEAPPEARSSPLPRKIGRLPAQARPGWRRRDWERAATGLALAAAAAGFYFQGLALRYDEMAEKDRAAAREIAALAEQAPDLRRVSRELAASRAYATLGGDGAPLSAAAAALATLSRFGFGIGDWTVDGEGFEAQIGPVRDLQAVRDAAEAIEAHPLLGEVSSQPGADAGMVMLSARIEKGAGVAKR